MGTLTPYLAPEGIKVFEQPVDKLQALDTLSAAVCSGLDTEVPRVQKAIREREKLLNTGLGVGLAVPHVRLPDVDDFALSVGLCRQGLDYGSLDGKPVYIVVLIVGPSRSHTEFVRFVAMVAGVLKQREFRAQLVQANGPAEVRKVLERF